MRSYLYAYADGYKDETKLREILPQLDSSNIDGINAVVIAARAKDSTIDPQEVWTKAAELLKALKSGERSVSEANLIHNLARLALEKEDLPRAAEYIDRAIEAYGIETSFHHRGAAYYWKSVILEKSGDATGAYQAARDSLAAWQDQFDKDPTNEEWQRRLEIAQRREAELALK